MSHYDYALRRCVGVMDIIGETMTGSEMFNECRRRIDNEIKIISSSSQDANGSATSLLSVVRARTALMTLKALSSADTRATKYVCIIDTVIEQFDHEIVRLATNIKLTEEDARRRYDAQIKMYSREIDVLEYENEMLRAENEMLRQENDKLRN